MQPLDLGIQQPRPPRETTLGILFLPRSIDKLRAYLPGGKPGPYNLVGLSEMMFEMFGTDSKGMLEAAATAECDDDIGRALLRHAPGGASEKWNEFISTREPRGGDREEALETYPWLADRPSLGLVLDVLAEDDARSFAGTPDRA